MKLKEYDIAVMDHSPEAIVWRVTKVIDKTNVQVVNASLDNSIKSIVPAKDLLPMTYQQLQSWNNK